jgi:hypothetical protein
MADPHPLQRGDMSTDLSDYNFSNEADRRQPNTYTVKSNPMHYHGEYPAADQAQAELGRKFKVGQAQPNLQAPWSVITMDGDNNGMPAEVHEISIREYGDAYDPTAPAKVRLVAPNESHWDVDTDGDGFRN